MKWVALLKFQNGSLQSLSFLPPCGDSRTCEALVSKPRKPAAEKPVLWGAETSRVV